MDIWKCDRWPLLQQCGVTNYPPNLSGLQQTFILLSQVCKSTGSLWFKLWASLGWLHLGLHLCFTTQVKAMPAGMMLLRCRSGVLEARTNGRSQHQASGCYGALYIHDYFTGQENHTATLKSLEWRKNLFPVNNDRGWKGRRSMIQYCNYTERPSEIGNS